MDVHTTIGRNVRRMRRACGIDHEDFAQAMRDRGFSMSTPTLSRLETGSRRVKVDELLALALLLNTSPLALVAPDPDESLTVTPDGAATPLAVERGELVDWWSHFNHPNPDVTPESLDEGSDLRPSKVYDLTREVEELRVVVRRLTEMFAEPKGETR